MASQLDLQGEISSGQLWLHLVRWVIPCSALIGLAGGMFVSSIFVSSIYYLVVCRLRRSLSFAGRRLSSVISFVDRRLLS